MKPVVADYVSGERATSDRNAKLQRRRNVPSNSVGLLSNARCLSEGVDVPTLNGVAFIDPRRSQRATSSLQSVEMGLGRGP